MRNVIIRGKELPTDRNGLVHLNTLHKLSGADRNKSPSQWLRRKEAQDVIEELEQDVNLHLGQLVSTVHGGANPGTYAHEVLAVSYAGWISPRFQVEVNTVFLAYKSGKLGTAEVYPPQKPLGEWSTEELKSKCTAANSYGKFCGKGAGRWAMEQLGFPMPPAHLMPSEVQLSFWSRGFDA